MSGERRMGVREGMRRVRGMPMVIKIVL
jgi:hypothetical protein